MVSFMFSYLLSLLLLVGGGNNQDMLDAVSTDVYWQLKHVTPDLAQLQKDAGADEAPASIDKLVKDLESADFGTRDKARVDLERMGPGVLPLLKPVTESKDAEVAAVAQDLVKKFTEQGKARAIRRLMAIRTLGERKEKESLGLLAGLKDSKEMFVADYAARATAAINGQAVKLLDLSQKLADDLALLPADTALVGQSTGLGTQRLTIASLIETALAGNREFNRPLMPGGGEFDGEVPPKKPDAKQLTQQATAQVLTLLEHVGNFRVDAVTVGFNDTKEDKPNAEEHGWFALILRGQYDSAAALDAVKELLGRDATLTPAEKPGDVATITMKHEPIAVLLPDDQRIVFLTGTEKAMGATKELFAAALKSGKGGLEKNAELAALLKTVDTHSPLWAVAKLPQSMSKEIMDGTFKTLTLESKRAKEGGGTEFTLHATTADADKAKAAVATVEGGLKEMQDDIKQEVAVMPAMKPAADMVASIKVSSEGASATMTGALPPGMLGAMMGQFPILEMLAPREVMPPMPMQIQDIPPAEPNGDGVPKAGE